ncbi:hypothetical protein B0H13DRAFT_2331427 [Mycena leptocephala]|nr:hypothetical protein B0H13DRAFT_2331427 [Mycena leptocephala]
MSRWSHQTKLVPSIMPAGMFFCITVNLPLVLAYNVNGQKMEKYYTFGTAFLDSPEACGPREWAAVDTCWYSETDAAETLRWLIGTQTVWILLTCVGEVGAFLIIVGYVIAYEVETRGFQANTQLGVTYTSEGSRRPGSTILRFRHIILRIDLSINAGRLLIYVLLAATDPFVPCSSASSCSPSFAHHTHYDTLNPTPRQGRTMHDIGVPSGCLSTVIIEMPPDEVETYPGWFGKQAAGDESQTDTGTSTAGAEEWYTGSDGGLVGIATKRARQINGRRSLMSYTTFNY